MYLIFGVFCGTYFHWPNHCASAHWHPLSVFAEVTICVHIWWLMPWVVHIPDNVLVVAVCVNSAMGTMSSLQLPWQLVTSNKLDPSFTTRDAPGVKYWWHLFFCDFADWLPVFTVCPGFRRGLTLFGFVLGSMRAKFVLIAGRFFSTWRFGFNFLLETIASTLQVTISNSTFANFMAKICRWCFSWLGGMCVVGRYVRGRVVRVRCMEPASICRRFPPHD